MLGAKVCKDEPNRSQVPIEFQYEFEIDDGVKVNYEKFQGVKVPIDGGKSLTMDLLGRI